MVVADAKRIPLFAEVVATIGSRLVPYGTTIAVLVAVLVIVTVGVSEANRMPLFAEVVAIIGSRFEPYGTTMAVLVAVLVTVAVAVAVLVPVAVGVSETKRIPLLAAIVATAGSIVAP